MARKAFTFDKNIHQTLYFAVDETNLPEILTYLHEEGVEKEWKTIRDLLKQGLRNKEKYCKCDVTQSASNMFEIRFTNQQRNDRIYCQELTQQKARIVVLCELFVGKKSQDIPKKIKNRIATLSKIEYEIHKD